MLKIRPIQTSDNEIIAEVVRKAMTEFNADPKTTVLGDPTLNTMYQNYQISRAAYFVAEWDGKVVGGAGIKQLDGGDKNICELQRMFLLKEARGKKIGKALMGLCTEKAKEFGYKQIYLETLKDMDAAKSLYTQSGFKPLPHPWGNTGHGGCDVWMVKDI